MLQLTEDDSKQENENADTDDSFSQIILNLQRLESQKKNYGVQAIQPKRVELQDLLENMGNADPKAILLLKPESFYQLKDILRGYMGRVLEGSLDLQIARIIKNLGRVPLADSINQSALGDLDLIKILLWHFSERLILDRLNDVVSRIGSRKKTSEEIKRSYWEFWQGVPSPDQQKQNYEQAVKALIAPEEDEKSEPTPELQTITRLYKKRYGVAFPKISKEQFSEVNILRLISNSEQILIKNEHDDGELLCRDRFEAWWYSEQKEWDIECSAGSRDWRSVEMHNQSFKHLKIAKITLDSGCVGTVKMSLSGDWTKGTVLWPAKPPFMYLILGEDDKPLSERHRRSCMAKVIGSLSQALNDEKTLVLCETHPRPFWGEELKEIDLAEYKQKVNANRKRPQ